MLDEERNRLSELIDLINQRLSYVEKRCNSHYQLTGESNDVSEVEGASLLDSLEERVKIIDKYTKNVKLEKELEEEIKSLSSKITLATEKMGINEALNVELEATFKKTLEDAFSRLGLYELRDAKDELDYAFYETEKSFDGMDRMSHLRSVDITGQNLYDIELPDGINGVEPTWSPKIQQ